VAVPGSSVRKLTQRYPRNPAPGRAMEIDWKYSTPSNVNLTGHSLELIADPLSSWDTLNLSYYVLYGGRQTSRDSLELNASAYALVFGRKRGDVTWSKPTLHDNRQKVATRWKHRYGELQAGVESFAVVCLG